MNSIHKLTVAFWIVGLALVAFLIYLADPGEVVRSVSLIGWVFVPVLMIRVLLLVIDSHSWRCLLERTIRPSVYLATLQRWIGESVSSMLPFATIGGELARVRFIIVTGMPGSLAFASIIMDGVVALISQFLFLCLGLALFAQNATGGGSLNRSILFGSVALFMAVLGIWMLVRRGAIGRLAEVLKRDLASDRTLWLADAMTSVDQHILAIAENGGAVTRSVVWRFLGWVVGALEIWLVLFMIGHPITFAEALILDAVTSAVRTAFFMVPGGLGVQEGALLAVGTALGIEGDPMLVAMVIKRAREIFFSIPGLLAWELAEAMQMGRSSQNDGRSGMTSRNR